MTQPLNYLPKAMVDLRIGTERRFVAQDAEAARYVMSKMEAAQAFVLPENGHILDRDKPFPGCSGTQLRPPFPVIALEYQATHTTTDSSRARSTRRIGLVWEWQDDLPPALKRFAPGISGDGVAVMSIAFYDEVGSWSSPIIGCFLPYDQMIEGDRDTITITQLAFGVMPSALEEIVRRDVAGPAWPDGVNAASVIDRLRLDVFEEVRSYLDLCCALACRNVRTREEAAPDALNRQRAKAGKLPLKGFHVLELSGGHRMPGASGAVGERSGPRSHLRRGHIRRLGGDRTTWVNSSVVRGRGFVDKVYAA